LAVADKLDVDNIMIH